jgi:large subunit ribosomal protein L17
LGARQGDNAERAMIELVDFNEIYGKIAGEAQDGAKKTRRGRTKKVATSEETPVETATETTTETAQEEKTEE